MGSRSVDPWGTVLKVGCMALPLEAGGAPVKTHPPKPACGGDTCLLFLIPLETSRLVRGTLALALLEQEMESAAGS